MPTEVAHQAKWFRSAQETRTLTGFPVHNWVSGPKMAPSEPCYGQGVSNPCRSMKGDNRPLVTGEPVEFEEQPVEGQDFRKFTHRFRLIYGVYLKLVKKNINITTCNRLDMETLGC